MVIADTNIFIAVFRRNAVADMLIRRYHTQLAVSVITEMELRIGATSTAKTKTLNALLSPYDILPLSKALGMAALKLITTYTAKDRQLTLGDALIAATCLNYNAGLLTFNTEDFRFIKGLHLVG